jgi:hypothetical protein
MVGRKFGRLTVLERAANRKNIHRYACICECGTRTEVAAADLRNGHTKSCGCWASEMTTKRNTSHGQSRSPTYHLWGMMKQRCTNPKRKEWKNYGGRGITYDPSWEDFEVFLSDMGEAPKGLSIDRIDVNGNYCKENCRWATDEQQANNTRRNRIYTVRGITGSIHQLVRHFEIPYAPSGILNKITRGWDVETALFSKVKPSPWLTKAVREQKLFLEMSKQEEDEIIEEYMDSVGLEGI